MIFKREKRVYKGPTLMPFPTTEQGLKDAGYEFEGRGMCNGSTCHEQIIWYRTPMGGRIPLDDPSLKPHWASCPDAKEFRRAKK